MTKDNLVTVPEGISLEESKKLLHEHRIEKLLVVDKDGRLAGMITIKDIEKIKKYPNACKDSMGRLRVGAAVGVGPDMEARAEALLKAGADVIAIDTSHGHSQNVIDAVIKLKGTFSGIELIAGNVGHGQGGRRFDQCRCGWCQDRYRTRFDLHDPDRGRYWRASGHGHFELPIRGQQNRSAVDR
jgi:IMP dehydrogenase